VGESGGTSARSKADKVMMSNERMGKVLMKGEPAADNDCVEVPLERLLPFCTQLKLRMETALLCSHLICQSFGDCVG
jgi:hypothetical protein